VKRGVGEVEGRRIPVKRTVWALGLSGVMLTTAVLSVRVPTVVQATARNFPTPVQHVVVIYQENHSFDNVLGNWCNTFTPARCDGFTGTVALKDGAHVAMTQATDLVPNVVHSVVAQAKAIDKGKMDNWDQIVGCTQSAGYGCLTYFTPSQIPNLTNLATQFAVSDRTFSMADSPSWGGHVYAVSSTLDGFTGDNPVPVSGVTAGPGWGCDSNKVSWWVNPSTHVKSQIPSCIPDPALGGNGGAFEPTPAQMVPTIMDRLDGAARTWHLYAANSSQAKPYNWNTCASFAECLYGPQQAKVLPTANILSDAAAGTLPNFSLVLPGGGPSGGTSQHNGASMLSGDNWIGKVVSAIENGPVAQWRSTAIFIAYDDCGCFYDHVAPMTNKDGTLQGPRVPLVIVSPYAKAHYTDSTPTTFAGILAYTEFVLGLTALNANDLNAYPYTNAFNYTQKPLSGVPMVQTPLPPGEKLPPPNTDDPT
jgi:phospholipase C